MKDNTLEKSFSWNYLDKITTQGLSLVISIVLARLIAPEQYGIIALATIFIQFLDAFVNPGFTSALIQKKNPEKADYSTIFWSNILISLILYSIIFIVSPFFESYYQIDNLSLTIRILALNLPFSSLNSIVVAYIQKNALYKRYFVVSFLGTFVSGGGAIASAYMGLGVWALVIYHLGNCVLDALFSLLFISWKPTLEFSKQRFKSLYSFGSKILYVKLIDVFFAEIRGLIIGKKYTPTALSHYKKGDTYPKTILQSVSMSVSDIMFPVFSNIQDKIEELTDALKKACRMCDFVIYPMAIGLLACGDNFIEILLTEQWLPCVPYLRIMCLYYLCTPSSGIMLQVIKALGKGTSYFKLECFKKAYSLLFLILSVIFFDSPYAITVSIIISGFISLFVNVYVVSRYTEYRVIEYIKGVLPIAGISAIMAFAVFSINLFHLNVLITIILQVVVGVIVYIFLAWIFKFEQLKDLHVLIKTQKRHE